MNDLLISLYHFLYSLYAYKTIDEAIAAWERRKKRVNYDNLFMIFDSTHYHAYQGRKKIKIYMGLKVGETVILLKKQGGQRRLVIDRINTPIVQGEWFE